jgi:hypothetical protein
VAWRDAIGDFYRNQAAIFRCKSVEEFRNYFAELWGCGNWDPLKCEFLSSIFFVSHSAEKLIQEYKDKLP